jgi:5-methylcytosine-specific restriction protein B
LKKRFDDFINSEQIRFTTFHQSFSYEDFVEGLRAETLNGAITYSTKSGIFKNFVKMQLNLVSIHLIHSLTRLRSSKKNEDSNDRLTLKTKNGKSFDVEYDGGNTFKVFPEQSVKDDTTYFANIENVRKLYVTGDKTKIYNPSYVVGLLSYLQSECGLPLEVKKIK